MDDNSLTELPHSVGDCKSMATHPWGSTHNFMTEKERLDAGVTEVRLLNPLARSTSDVNHLRI